MGIDIRNVDIVVQLGLLQFVTSMELWQRMGRCARDPEINGLGITFVKRKYIC